jgi:integrase
MRTRHQKGYVYKKNGAWFVRFYENVIGQDETITRTQRAIKLADVDDNHRSKKSVMPLVEELLRPMNDGTYTPLGTMMIGRFYEQVYLPAALRELSVSTMRGYQNVWRRYLKPRMAQARLRDWRVADSQRLLNEIAAPGNLSRAVLNNIRTVGSAVFSQAVQLGYISTQNPMRGVRLPKGRKTESTHAYSLSEIRAMLEVLESEKRTAIAVFAFSGVSVSECRALRWENYDGSTLTVAGGAWNGHLTAGKNEYRLAPIPVIPLLRQHLDAHHRRCGSPTEGFIFASPRGTPLYVHNWVRRDIKPALDVIGLRWRGFHAFRRGLATNLNHLGVKPKTIQQILRHGDWGTTMNIYAKALDEDSVAAMEKLDAVCTKLGFYAPNSDEAVTVN